MQNDGHAPARRAIEVEFRPADEPAFAARLLGEHDVASGDELREAFEALDGSVLVDLQSCGFIDSTVIRVLLAAASARKRDGHLLELIVLEDAKIVRVLDITGVRDVISVRATDGLNGATPAS